MRCNKEFEPGEETRDIKGWKHCVACYAIVTAPPKGPAVVCARCGKDIPENEPSVQFAGGHYHAACWSSTSVPEAGTGAINEWSPAGVAAPNDPPPFPMRRVDLPSYQPSSEPSGPRGVRLVAIDVSIGDLAVLLVKLVFAAIPAGIITGIILGVLWAIIPALRR